MERKQVGNSQIGAAAELVVCADLFRRGYHVFRALAPNCPCDLIAMKDGEILRVEVKSAGFVGTTGRCSIAVPVPSYGKFDLLAVVAQGQHVFYVPEMPEQPPFGADPQVYERILRGIQSAGATDD
jgi:hypothetical protein